MADDFLTALWNTASNEKSLELLAFLGYQQEQRKRFTQSKPKEDRVDLIPRLCPYCDRWYEQGNKNGKLWVKCPECTQAWERNRKPSKKPDGWVEGYPTRKRCRICTKSRMVNIDRVCTKCFSENKNPDGKKT